jgi:hypothetical protein
MQEGRARFAAAIRRSPHITDEQMKAIMKSAVDTLYRLLWQRECDPVGYKEKIALGRRYTRHWDDPELKKLRGKGHALRSESLR